LENKKYCILNKRYSKGEWERLAKEIIKELKEQGRW